MSSAHNALPSPQTLAASAYNALPSPQTLAAIAGLPVLDREGHSHPFASLYGRSPNARLLVVFVRHFFCGNCQAYLNMLSDEIPPSRLAAVRATEATPPAIVVIGCGDPALIDDYVAVSRCAYPVYADPSRRLYDALGMIQTLRLGSVPRYLSARGVSFLSVVAAGIRQGLAKLPQGLALKSGHHSQVGGEFLFVTEAAASDTPLAVVTWCHRMTTTRDHAEVEELCQVLGLSAEV